MKIDHKESFKDFGKQFLIDNQLDGYWGSKDLLATLVHPFDINEIKDKIVMEVGVGAGRIIKNLLIFKPKKIVGIEPSEAINVAKNNINSPDVTILNVKGEDITFENEFDYIFSIGVIHHIPKYKEVLKKINQSLKENGKFIIWVYGKEGNEIYLFIFNNFRRIAILLPDVILRLISQFLALTTYFYGFLCKYINLPLNKYFTNFFNKFSFKHRSYVIFDQLNPSFAKYFKKEELKKVLDECGFEIEQLDHKFEYSYTAICKKKQNQ